MQEHRPEGSLLHRGQQGRPTQQAGSLGAGRTRARYVRMHAADRYNVPFMETSAKNALNVNELFENLTKQMMKLNQGTVKSARRPPPLPLKNEEDEVCKCCN